MLQTTPPHAPMTGLLLAGGGARAAYQVGVLQAIAALRRLCGQGRGPNPFPIITGTSAGAINGAALACGADHFEHAVRRIARMWSHIRVGHVYHADSLHVMQSGARWLTLLSLGWALARWQRTRPHSLLNNAPLDHLLTQMVPLVRLPLLIRQGHLHALAVTASSYSSGEHVTYFEAAPQVEGWTRSQRKAERTRITTEHLLASSAIPFVFPAQPLDIEHRQEYFGDGSMRQSAPLAPAIHMGAQRLLVIGTGRLHEPPRPGQPPPTYPTLAQIAGHALSNIFLDALGVDVERALRVNRTVGLIPPAQRAASGLRAVDVLMIVPSERIDDIAARHITALPLTMRTMLGALGVTSEAGDVRGSALLSYLLFERAYTRELMALGYVDTLARRAEVCQFFAWQDPGSALPERAPYID
ncbi:MAG: patatin-like phospholipase family protein [Comamonadaceae bacterium]|nr:patatin-like phospholipase family protein [Comamonadaceae bacterium]